MVVGRLGAGGGPGDLAESMDVATGQRSVARRSAAQRSASGLMGCAAWGAPPVRWCRQGGGTPGPRRGHASAVRACMCSAAQRPEQGLPAEALVVVSTRRSDGRGHVLRSDGMAWHGTPGPHYSRGQGSQTEARPLHGGPSNVSVAGPCVRVGRAGATHQRGAGVAAQQVGDRSRRSARRGAQRRRDQQRDQQAAAAAACDDASHGDNFQGVPMAMRVNRRCAE